MRDLSFTPIQYKGKNYSSCILIFIFLDRKQGDMRLWKNGSKHSLSLIWCQSFHAQIEGMKMYFK